MKSIFVFLVFFIAFAAGKLELVIEFIRHGARGPSDSTWNPEKWGNGFDIHQLTEVGMRQTYILGREMRNRYIERENLLSKKYNNTELYVRSTSSSRALQSASSHLYGLYPLGTGLEIDQNYPLDIAVPPYQNLTLDIPNMGYDALPRKFQPIEIHSLDQEKDMLLNYANLCPTYQILKNQQEKKQLFQDLNVEFKETLEHMQEIFKTTDSSPWNITKVSRFVTNIYADIYKNNPLPEGLTSDIWRNMTVIKDLERQYVELGSDLQRKFMGTPLFKEIQKYFLDKINNPDSDLKYVFFSGHYLTLTPLMVGLNITNLECLINKFHGLPDDHLNCENGYPIYASQILIELHSRVMETGMKKHFVKVIYNGKEMNLCEKGKIECEFEEYNNRIQKEIIVNDFNKLCYDPGEFTMEKKENEATKEEKQQNGFLNKFSKFLSHADNGMRSSMFY
jgi:hypothetical protein